MRKTLPRNHTSGTFTFSFAGLKEAMKSTILLIPAIGLLAAASAVAQDEAAEAASDAAETAAAAIADAAEAPQPPPIVVPLAPPPVVSTPARQGKSREPEPLDWQAISPEQSDYPRASWVANEEGRVSYEVQVTREGTPIDCVVVESSGSLTLDAKTCAVVIERGTFDPALDEQGMPTAGTFGNAYSWRKREPEFPGSMTVRVQFLIDENGETTECEVLEMSGQMSEGLKRSFEREPCPGTRNNRAPYRDEKGVPVAKRVTVAFDIAVEDPTE